MPHPDEGTTPAVTPEPEVKTPATGDPAPASSDQVEGKTAKEWLSSYKGLQAAYQKLQTSTTTEIADLTARLEAANAKIEELGLGTKGKETEVSALQTQLASRSQELATLKDEHGTVTSQLARQKVILSKFPELAQWEANGLLPTGDSEETLVASLEKFKEQLQNQIGSGVATTLSGAIPVSKREPASTKTPAGEHDRQYILDRMIETAGRDQKAYREWQIKLDDFDAAAQGKSQ